MIERTRRVVHRLMTASSVSCLVGAGVSGVWFADHPMDMVLIQLVFYGGWATLVGAFLGGMLGAEIEEDACGELDMGTLSSMGGILGALAAGLLGTAITGLALHTPWQAVWGAAVALEAGHLALRWRWPFRLVRRGDLDARGCRCDANGRRLPEDQQPLRMRDRVAVLITLGAACMLALTLLMARTMGSDLGHPVMMAPMMYGMFGTMLGGMVGGWLAGLLDEHQGDEAHDNPVMVGAMALMAGMMGGMPSGMIGGMMAVMGLSSIGATIAAGAALVGIAWWMMVVGRYSFRSGRPPATGAVRAAVGRTLGGLTFQVVGMTCGACVDKVQRAASRVDGVATVQVDLASSVVQLKWGDGFPGLDAVREAIETVGYAIRGDD